MLSCLLPELVGLRRWLRLGSMEFIGAAAGVWGSVSARGCFSGFEVYGSSRCRGGLGTYNEEHV